MGCGGKTVRNRPSRVRVNKSFTYLTKVIHRYFRRLNTVPLIDFQLFHRYTSLLKAIANLFRVIHAHPINNL